MCRRSPCVSAKCVIPPPKRTVPVPVTVDGEHVCAVQGGAQAQKTGPQGSGLDTLQTSMRGPFRTEEGVGEPALR